MQEHFTSILKELKISFENYAEVKMKNEKDIDTLLSSWSSLEEGIIGKYSIKIPKIGGKIYFRNSFTFL